MSDVSDAEVGELLSNLGPEDMAIIMPNNK